jgi:GGDEF domain-containing protein
VYAINKNGDILDKKKKAQANSDNEDQQTTTIAFKQVNLFGKQVVEKMIKENIPPTPANFSIYFEKLLEDKPQSQKKNINNILELEDVENFDYVSKIEDNIQDSFTKIKAMMDSISTVYTKINKLMSITDTKRKELTKSSDKLALASYNEDLETIYQGLTKQQKSIKNQYNEVISVIKNFNSESIFDKKYGVYNKRYLLDAVESEQKKIEHFNHDSTLLALKIKDSSISSVRLARDREMIAKTVGKMILKRSRRSDIITHFDDGIFVLLLKHTNLEQASITIERIENIISFSNYIVDSQSIEIELNFALTKIVTDKTKEQIVASVLETLPNR